MINHNDSMNRSNYIKYFSEFDNLLHQDNKYYNKYLKYKQKYLSLKIQIGGENTLKEFITNNNELIKAFFLKEAGLRRFPMEVKTLFENGYIVTCIIEDDKIKGDKKIKLTIMKDDNIYIFFIGENYPFDTDNYYIHKKNGSILSYNGIKSPGITFLTIIEELNKIEDDSDYKELPKIFIASTGSRNGKKEFDPDFPSEYLHSQGEMLDCTNEENFKDIRDIFIKGYCRSILCDLQTIYPDIDIDEIKMIIGPSIIHNQIFLNIFCLYLKYKILLENIDNKHFENNLDFLTDLVTYLINLWLSRNIKNILEKKFHSLNFDFSEMFRNIHKGLDITKIFKVAYDAVKNGDYTLTDGMLVEEIEKFTELIKFGRLNDVIMRIQDEFPIKTKSNI